MVSASGLFAARGFLPHSKKGFADILPSLTNALHWHTPHTAQADSPSSRYPWMVCLEIIRGVETFRCGGTLINSTTILTAAHCVATNRDEVAVSQITVKIGAIGMIPVVKPGCSDRCDLCRAHLAWLRFVRRALTANSLSVAVPCPPPLPPSMFTCRLDRSECSRRAWGGVDHCIRLDDSP